MRLVHEPEEPRLSSARAVSLHRTSCTSHFTVRVCKYPLARIHFLCLFLASLFHYFVLSLSSILRPMQTHTCSPTRAREYSVYLSHICLECMCSEPPRNSPAVLVLLVPHLHLHRVCKSRRVNCAFLRVFGNSRRRTASHPATRKCSCLSGNCFMLLFRFSCSLPIPIPDSFLASSIRDVLDDTLICTLLILFWIFCMRDFLEIHV